MTNHIHNDLFENKFVLNHNEKYFILTSAYKIDDQWHRIEPIITQDYVYFPYGAVAVYSSIDFAKNKNIGTPLELICLSCFYHIMRKTMKLRSSTIDDIFNVQIKPWRAPCESTAIFNDMSGKTYYLEGCKEIGVYWRDSKEKPRTEPPFISCGAFDSNAGCWGEDCPYGYYSDDEEEPFSLFI